MEEIVKMTDFSLWFLIITIVLISFTLLMFGAINGNNLVSGRPSFAQDILSMITWCSHEAVDTLYYNAAWKRMAIPEHDSFTVSIPPLPPYFFESVVNYDHFSESV